MASKAETVEYIIEQIQGLGEVRYKRMFGEYGIYYREKMVALVCDDQLFIKPTTVGKEYLVEPEEGQPYPGAKNWFLISEDCWEDRDWLCELIRLSEPEIALPIKKKKKA